VRNPKVDKAESPQCVSFSASVLVSVSVSNGRTENSTVEMKKMEFLSIFSFFFLLAFSSKVTADPTEDSGNNGPKIGLPRSEFSIFFQKTTRKTLDK
jgi:hypothetical protein